MSMRKLGIMGGTFDPLHLGHLALAEAVRDNFELDGVIFMPSGRPPHKEGEGITSSEDRFKMTELGCADNPFFTVSRLEIDRKGKTYSVDTVRELKELYGDETEFYFIIGADSLMDLEDWKDAPKLLRLCRFAAVSRPGFKDKKAEAQAERLSEKYGAKIEFMELSKLDISSTEIRNRVAEGKSVKYIVPKEVEKYIQEHNLYGFKPEFYPEVGGFKRRLKKELKESRYIHTLGVAEESCKLAEKFGEDKRKAYNAGLLHDCAKNFGREKAFELCKKYGVFTDEVLKEQPDLIHSFLGAAVAENEYGIDDPDILNAIRYHTTGRAGMSRLEMIVYLADMIEPNRTAYEGLDKIRKLAYDDLKEAVTLALKRTVEFNRERGRIIHPLSLEAYEYYKQN